MNHSVEAIKYINLNVSARTFSSTEFLISTAYSTAFFISAAATLRCSSEAIGEFATKISKSVRIEAYRVSRLSRSS